MTSNEVLAESIRNYLESGVDLLLTDDDYRTIIKALEQEPILDKIKSEIADCLKALDEIEKSGFNIYLPNEISGRRLTYQQCLGFIGKYKAESEGKE